MRLFQIGFVQNKAGRHMGNGFKTGIAQGARRCQLAQRIGGIDQGDEDRRALGQAFLQKRQFFDLLGGDFKRQVLQKFTGRIGHQVRFGGAKKMGSIHERASRRVSPQNGWNGPYSPKYLRQQQYETDHLPCHKSVFDCDMALMDKVPELSQRCGPRRKPMFGDKPKDVPQPFALILVPEFTMMPVTSAIEPLRLANRMSEKALYRWTMHSVDGQPVAASNSILTMVNGDLETVPPHATIIVCAGLNVQHHSDKRLMSWLRKTARRGNDIGAVCTGRPSAGGSRHSRRL